MHCKSTKRLNRVLQCYCALFQVVKTQPILKIGHMWSIRCGSAWPVFTENHHVHAAVLISAIACASFRTCYIFRPALLNIIINPASVGALENTADKVPAKRWRKQIRLRLLVKSQEGNVIGNHLN